MYSTAEANGVNDRGAKADRSCSLRDIFLLLAEANALRLTTCVVALTQRKSTSRPGPGKSLGLEKNECARPCRAAPPAKIDSWARMARWLAWGKVETGLCATSTPGRQKLYPAGKCIR